MRFVVEILRSVKDVKGPVWFAFLGTSECPCVCDLVVCITKATSCYASHSTSICSQVVGHNTDQNGAKVFKDGCMCRSQEFEKLQSAKLRLERELTAARERWLVERQQIVEQKEAEKREALLEVRNQSEKDYKEFLQEHKDTLNKALTEARKQFSRDKVRLLFALVELFYF